MAGSEREQPEREHRPQHRNSCLGSSSGGLVAALAFCRTVGASGARGLGTTTLCIRDKARDSSGDSEGRQRGGELQQGSRVAKVRMVWALASLPLGGMSPSSLGAGASRPKRRGHRMTEEHGSVLSWFPGLPRPPSWKLNP